MLYFDKHIFSCINCGHIWVLGSDKFITEKQYIKWMEEVNTHHTQISDKRKKRDDT